MRTSLEDLYQHVRELREQVETDALQPRPDAAFGLFSDTPDTTMTKFAEMEPRAHRVWSMETSWVFDPDDPSFELNERSWKRGVDSLLITTERALSMNPIMMAHCGPRVWIGPALINMIIVNDDFVVVEGIRLATGFVSLMCASRPDAVEAVRAIFGAALALSRQAFPEHDAPLTARQVLVARGLARGWSDSFLAHQLGVSLRTVERDASAVTAYLRTASRAEAVSRMSGRNFNAAEEAPDSDSA